jgi:hypothetical protein
VHKQKTIQEAELSNGIIRMHSLLAHLTTNADADMCRLNMLTSLATVPNRQCNWSIVLLVSYQLDNLLGLD